MIAGNIFEWIGSLFTDFLFTPFNWLRLTIAKSDAGWWTSNAVNWFFLLILLVLFAYWMKEAARFKKEGTEDRA
ncbi:DUF6341 family protein [Tenacibaculum sp. L6]|uniref:DUF6341 family protein n=1 Tax=Tenacibaculum sp. L6 TaxID=2992764 RepID=UPI00237BAE4C|nr:hypothetical protein [Tenacibaculum sp. L6]MDE0535670.1 hypothetical protein [Tenacibaculum sp. L6]